MKKSLASETQREMVVMRVGAYAWVVGLALPGILVRERLRAFPQTALETLFGEAARPLEHDGKTAEDGRGLPIILNEIEQQRVYPEVVPGRGDVTRDHDCQLVAGQRRFGADARKRRLRDEAPQILGQRVVLVAGLNQHEIRPAAL